jgi:hypothetical protein
VRRLLAPSLPTNVPRMASRAQPESLLDLELPDLELPSSQGGTYRLRGRVGIGPQVLFFYLRNGTPG